MRNRNKDVDNRQYSPGAPEKETVVIGGGLGGGTSCLRTGSLRTAGTGCGGRR